MSRTAMSATDAAKELGLHRSTIVAWARSGRIQAVRGTNGRWAVSRRSVDAALDDARQAIGLPAWFQHRRVLTPRVMAEIKAAHLG